MIFFEDGNGVIWQDGNQIRWQQRYYIVTPAGLIVEGSLSAAAELFGTSGPSVVTYECMLGDLTVPMQSFTGAFRLLNPSTLTVVVPGVGSAGPLADAASAYLALVMKNIANQAAYASANEAARLAYNQSGAAHDDSVAAYYAAYDAALAVYQAAAGADYQLNPEPYAYGAADNAYDIYVMSVDASATPGTNVGNGECTGVALGIRPKAGAYSLICRRAVPGSGLFWVRDPQGKVLPDAIAGAAYDHLQIKFTIQVGLTDYAVGDTFMITVDDDGPRLTDTGGGGAVNYDRRPEPIPEVVSSLGELRVYMVRTYHRNARQLRELVQAVDLDGISYAEDPNNAASIKSIILTGSRRTISDPKTIALSGASYQGISAGKRSYRCTPNYNVRPGDTVQILGESLVAESVGWTISVDSQMMDVSEKG